MTDDHDSAPKDIDLLELTAHIVSAYVEKNRLPASGLPDLIASVSTSIRSIWTAIWLNLTSARTTAQSLVLMMNGGLTLRSRALLASG